MAFISSTFRLPHVLRRALLPAALGFAVTAWAAFPVTVSLSTVNGTDGTRSDGVASSDFLGFSVSSAGDLNGDGLADYALGAPSSATQPGTVYVVFGVTGGLPYPLDLAALNGTNGFRIDGASANSQAGSALASGDVNADGLSDLVIGAPGASEVYVVFGQAGGFAANLPVASLDGSNGFKLQGPATALTGYSVSIGDVNGDAIADIAVGNGAANLDVGYVLFGGGAVSASIDLTLLDGINGIKLSGASVNQPYFAVGAAGDVNGDGIGDLLIGSPYAGTTYVLFGRRATLRSLYAFDGATVNVASPLYASQLNDPAGIGAAGSWFGYAVSGAGDLNGDGISDILVGAPMAALTPAVTYAGKSYVVFGNTSFPATLDVSTLNGSNGGFLINGAVRNNRSGWSVAQAGDVNADGLADILIGAPNSSYAGTAGGASYVIFGTTGALQNINLNGGLDGTNGFQVVGPRASQSGFSVSGAGDVNGDGTADIVIGARLSSTATLANTGSAYVLYGHP